MRVYFFCMNGVKGADRYRAFGKIFDGDRVLLAFFQFVLLIEGIADDRDADEKENEERIICSAEEWYEEAEERTKDTGDFDIKRVGLGDSGREKAGVSK